MAGDPADLQIMYSISGARRLTEFDLDWLPGYEGSKPVRVGNAASGQFQLDVYGEVMAAIYAARRMGLEGTEAGWVATKDLLTFLEAAWQRPDDGIWEVRGGRRHFTHSKVMAWVAFDRLIKVIAEFGFGGDEGKGMLAHLGALRERIHAEVCERGFAGRIAEAEELFERLLFLRNHLGLLSEEYDPKLQRLISNFPQAFSHLALILSARIIDTASQKRSIDEPALGHGTVDAYH